MTSGRCRVGRRTDRVRARRRRWRGSRRRRGLGLVDRRVLSGDDDDAAASSTRVFSDRQRDGTRRVRARAVRDADPRRLTGCRPCAAGERLDAQRDRAARRRYRRDRRRHGEAAGRRFLRNGDLETVDLERAFARCRNAVRVDAIRDGSTSLPVGCRGEGNPVHTARRVPCAVARRRHRQRAVDPGCGRRRDGAFDRYLTLRRARSGARQRRRASA